MKQFIARYSLVIICLTLGSLVAGCASRAAPAPTAAPTATSAITDNITVYTALEEDQVARYLPLFQARYPNIKVNVFRESTGVITDKLLAEKADPVADDVWGLAATSLLIADAQGMLEPYAPAGIDRIRVHFRDTANQTPHWEGIDAWMTAFCVNANELRKRNLPMPHSWQDLLDPAFKGQIVMPNPVSSGTGFLDVSGLLQMHGEDAGWKFLDSLDQNVAVYVHSGSQPCTRAVKGDYTVGISFDYRAVTEKNNGAAIEVVFPVEGSGWEIEANGLVKKNLIKPAARMFLDWAITDPAMLEYAKSYPITAAPISLAIPAGYPPDPIKQLTDNDFIWAAANRDRILKEWTKRYDSKSAPK